MGIVEGIVEGIAGSGSGVGIGRVGSIGDDDGDDGDEDDCHSDDLGDCKVLMEDKDSHNDGCERFHAAKDGCDCRADILDGEDKGKIADDCRYDCQQQKMNSRRQIHFDVESLTAKHQVEAEDDGTNQKNVKRKFESVHIGDAGFVDADDVKGVGEDGDEDNHDAFWVDYFAGTAARKEVDAADCHENCCDERDADAFMKKEDHGDRHDDRIKEVNCRGYARRYV